MNILQLPNAVFLAGLVVQCVIRHHFVQRTKSEKKKVRRFDNIEKILLAALFPPVLLLPLVYAFTPLLSFADYHLPWFIRWAASALPYERNGASRQSSSQSCAFTAEQPLCQIVTTMPVPLPHVPTTQVVTLIRGFPPIYLTGTESKNVDLDRRVFVLQISSRQRNSQFLNRFRSSAAAEQNSGEKQHPIAGIFTKEVIDGTELFSPAALRAT